MVKYYNSLHEMLADARGKVKEVELKEVDPKTVKAKKPATKKKSAEKKGETEGK